MRLDWRRVFRARRRSPAAKRPRASAGGSIESRLPRGRSGGHKQTGDGGARSRAIGASGLRGGEAASAAETGAKAEAEAVESQSY